MPNGKRVLLHAIKRRKLEYVNDELLIGTNEILINFDLHCNDYYIYT